MSEEYLYNLLRHALSGYIPTGKDEVDECAAAMVQTIKKNNIVVITREYYNLLTALESKGK